jgi:hypothetical protein
MQIIDPDPCVVTKNVTIRNCFCTEYRMGRRDSQYCNWKSSACVLVMNVAESEVKLYRQMNIWSWMWIRLEAAVTTENSLEVTFTDCRIPRRSNSSSPMNSFAFTVAATSKWIQIMNWGRNSPCSDLTWNRRCNLKEEIADVTSERLHTLS